MKNFMLEEKLYQFKKQHGDLDLSGIDGEGDQDDQDLNDNLSNDGVPGENGSPRMAGSKGKSGPMSPEEEAKERDLNRSLNSNDPVSKQVGSVGKSKSTRFNVFKLGASSKHGVKKKDHPAHHIVLAVRKKNPNKLKASIPSKVLLKLIHQFYLEINEKHEFQNSDLSEYVYDFFM